MLTVIVAGRNDDYGKDFRSRLFRTALHNSALLNAAGIQFEYILAEWNPLPIARLSPRNSWSRRRTPAPSSSLPRSTRSTA